MKTFSRYTRWIIPAAMMLTVLARGLSWGATPQVAAGSNHTIFLHSDGTLWSAGLNTFGQLGDGSFTDRATAVRIGTERSWTAIAAGSEHNLALKADGTLWAWGRSDSGQLGKTGAGGSPVPEQNAPVQVGSARDWIAVAASGGATSYALKGDGTLWAFGDNSDGRIGNGDAAALQVNLPVQVINPSANGNRFVAVASGGAHALALMSDGSLWGWGSNSSGQLGLGAADSLPHATPTQIVVASALSDNDWSAIAAGESHSLALKADGTLWSFGGNGSGQLGTGTAPDEPLPVQVGHDSDWAKIAAGALHSLALKRSGILYSFGDNRSGQLGNGSLAARNTPVPVPSLSDVVALAAGDFHTVALKSNGELYAFGDNGTGQFGNGALAGVLSPLLVGSDAPGWLASDPGNQFTVARRSNGTLWGWGDNSSGQLGVGVADGVLHGIPAQIGSGSNWAAQASGFGHVVALASDGTLWSWGDNSFGQLGDGTLAPAPAPKQITATNPSSAKNDWAAVAAGDGHTLALKGDGTLWGWGDDSSGQLGDGSAGAPVLAPKQIVTGNPGNFDRNWIAVAAGGSHSLGLQADGTLWAWGDNALGQLGDPGEATSSTPVQVINFTPPTPGYNSGWKGIAAGLGHSLALQADGTAWAFGSNFSGQLGNADPALPHPASQPLPVQVVNAGSAPYVALSAGDAYSALRRADGTLWSSGSNTSGELGIGSSDPDPFNPVTHPTPLQEGLHSNAWSGAGVGGSHTVALRADGTLWAFGSDFSGQLGDGSTNDRNLPAPLLEGFASVAASLDLGPMLIGGSAASGNLTISNPGSGALFVTNVALSGSDASLFVVSAGSCSGTTSFAVPAQGSCQLLISAAPAATAGASNALLTIDSSDPVHPQVQVALAAQSVRPFIVTTSAAPAAGGSISPAGSLAELPGSTPLFTMAANTGYHLVDVTLNGVSQGAKGTVTLAPMTSDVALAATFAINSYTITLNSGAHGIISGPTTVNFGDTPSFSITPAPGAFITDVTVNGVSRGAVSSVLLPPVTGDVTVAATFGVTTFAVNGSGDARGSVSPASVQVPFGASQTFSFVPNPGYQVVDVVVDGVSQGPLPSYTFTNVTANGHTVKAVFIPDGDVNSDGRVDIADALTVLRIAVGLDTATQLQLLHGDVAPLDLAGIPAPDQTMGIADALLTLRKAVGLTSGF